MDDEIAQYREELKRRPPGDTGRETALYNLAESTRKRFKRTDDIEDIMEAIELHRTALELRPEGHPDCHSLLCQLTWCLIEWYRKQGRLPDLEEAITLAERAVLDLRLGGHPNQS